MSRWNAVKAKAINRNVVSIFVVIVAAIKRLSGQKIS